MAATAMGAAPPNNKPVIFDPYQGAVGAAQGTGTGALCTGIGFGLNVVIGALGPAPNFTDDVQPKLHRIGQAWTAAYICAFGNGIARDDTAGKAAPMKLVTAAADVAAGAVVETGFTNNTGATLKTGQSTFGSAAAVAAAPKALSFEEIGEEVATEPKPKAPARK